VWKRSGQHVIEGAFPAGWLGLARKYRREIMPTQHCARQSALPAEICRADHRSGRYPPPSASAGTRSGRHVGGVTGPFKRSSGLWICWTGRGGGFGLRTCTALCAGRHRLISASSRSTIFILRTPSSIRTEHSFASLARIRSGFQGECATIRLRPIKGRQRAPLPVANSMLVSDVFFDAIHDAPGMQASGIGIPALPDLQHSHPALHEWGTSAGRLNHIERDDGRSSKELSLTMVLKYGEKRADSEANYAAAFAMSAINRAFAFSMVP
jgi:hypothetical protein